MSERTPLPRELEDCVVEILARALVNDLRMSRNAAKTQGEGESTVVPRSGHVREPAAPASGLASTVRRVPRKPGQRPA
jgi:hypothetical protein